MIIASLLSKDLVYSQQISKKNKKMFPKLRTKTPNDKQTFSVYWCLTVHLQNIFTLNIIKH